MKTQIYKTTENKETEFKSGYVPRLSSGKIGEITINLQITIDTLYNIKTYCNSDALIPNEVLNAWLLKCGLPIQPIAERKNIAQADKMPSISIFDYYKTLNSNMDKLSLIFTFRDGFATDGGPVVVYRDAGYGF